MKCSFVLSALLASATVLSAAAQTPAAPAAAPEGPAKIAVIAFQATVAQTNEFQRNLADLQKKFEPRRQELKNLSDEVDKLTKQLQEQGATLSEAERASRAGAIDTKKKQLDRNVEDAQNDFQQGMQEVFNGVAAKVYDVMSSYAKQQGFTLILDVSEQASPVLYAVESSNISKPVLDAYNLKSGVPAPAASAAPAASQPAHAPAATHPRTTRPAAH